MNHEFINPNWHVILIHLPLGVFVLGMLIELCAFLYRHSPIRGVARGMIWLGALTSIPTAYSGIYALSDVVRAELPAGISAEPKPWHETRTLASGPGGISEKQWDLISGHVWCQAIATGVAAVLVTLGLGANDRWRSRLHWPLMAGLLFALVAMAWGAYYGGEMVYSHGVAVHRPHGTLATTEPSIPTTTESPTTETAAVPSGIRRYMAPLQLHVTLAGIAVAVALAALGMSLRVLSTADEWRDPEVAPARNLLDLEAGPGEAAASRTSPDFDAGRGPVGVPSARVWLLTSLIVLLTIVAGAWFLASLDEVGAWKPQNLWKAVAGKERRLYHMIGGTSLFVLPLILALVARVARRSKFLLASLSALLLIAAGAQLWLGILLLFDSNQGSPFHFNKAGEIAARVDVK